MRFAQLGSILALALAGVVHSPVQALAAPLSTEGSLMCDYSMTVSLICCNGYLSGAKPYDGDPADIYLQCPFGSRPSYSFSQTFTGTVLCSESSILLSDYINRFQTDPEAQAVLNNASCQVVVSVS